MCLKNAQFFNNIITGFFLNKKSFFSYNQRKKKVFWIQKTLKWEVFWSKTLSEWLFVWKPMATKFTDNNNKKDFFFGRKTGFSCDVMTTEMFEKNCFLFSSKSKYKITILKMLYQ